MVAVYDWDVNTALAVMRAESGCRPNAVGVNRNGSTDKGLFQINSIHSDLISDTDRLDPGLNIKAAHQIYQGRGWRAWVAYTTGKYKTYL